ncbi:SdpI family protein [Corynebacterium uterequi]|uniref:SdpI/YhfL protein family n=1 Tax=Corynebacterium uterequi TaxID=1072256 RepID=A0A0G3HFS1_9CORY|nr:SdpI family protein [Corynebacterium uterequi]AKK12166.1 SdpI/YhfL protein family [Corynebacterium uterequi]
MNTPGLVIGSLLGVLALIVMVVGLLAAARKLPGNNVFGLRVAEVRKSREVWEAAHHIAGLFWVLGGVTLLFASLVSFVATGWLWLLPAVMVVVAVGAVGAGANVGARTAAVLDAAREAEDDDASVEQPAPTVDLSALRTAATRADGQADGQGDGRADASTDASTDAPRIP